MEPQKIIRDRETFSAYVVLLATTILLVAASLPAHPVQVFHITVSDRLLGVATLLLGDAVVWFFAYWGYIKLHAYAAKLEGTTEGKAMGRLAAGIGLLALSLALPGIVWRGASTFALPGTDVETIRSLLSAYLGLALTIAGFGLLYNALYILVRHVGVSVTIRRTRGLFISVFSAIVGAGFIYIMVYNYARYRASFSLLELLLTIVVPYLLAWFIGALCVSGLQLYADEVSGAIYKSAFRWLSAGITVLIVMQIAVQCVEGSLAYAHNLPSGLAAAIILTLSALQAASFILIAQGANLLRKIEEV